ncbi:MAG: hypothetical protein OEY78_05720 [Gammaproteobacteria bacterium]|nr:hypothetical protein [Gammaproteobacteria bacterium]
MKKYLFSAFMMLLSFSAFAEEPKENIAMETCTEMAQEQELTGENAQVYISECVKTFNDDEKSEKEEDKG